MLNLIFLFLKTIRTVSQGHRDLVLENPCFTPTDLCPPALCQKFQFIQYGASFPDCTIKVMGPLAQSGAHRSARQGIKRLGIEKVVPAPRSPWRNPYVERLNGSIRRELLDHVIDFNDQHLCRMLCEYFRYYHICRNCLFGRQPAA